MKKMIIILTLICVASVGAQEKCDFTKQNLDLNYNDIVLYQGAPATGAFCDFYDNGSLAKMISLEQGYVEGISKAYYENGILKEETPYKLSKIDGIQKSYYESGELRSVVPYAEGLRSGVAEMYWVYGKLMIELQYKQDKSEGAFIAYKYDRSPHMGVIYKDYEVIWGVCSNGKVFTADEITSWNNGNLVLCE